MLDGGVEEGVERSLGDVLEVPDAPEKVSLAPDSTKALLEIGRPPWAIKVMDGRESRLDVCARAQLLSRTHEDAHLARTNLLEQCFFLLRIVAGIADASNLLGGNSRLDEASPHIVLDIPFPRGRGRTVAKDELRTAHVGRLLPDFKYLACANLTFAALHRLKLGVHQLRVECDLHAVARDRKQIVVALCISGTDALAADAELFDFLELLRRGGHGDMDLLALGDLEVHGLLRDDVRKGSVSAHELREVMELREALFQLEAVALRLDLHRVLYRAERERPRRER